MIIIINFTINIIIFNYIDFKKLIILSYSYWIIIKLKNGWFFWRGLNSRYTRCLIEWVISIIGIQIYYIQYVAFDAFENESPS